MKENKERKQIRKDSLKYKAENKTFEIELFGQDDFCWKEKFSFGFWPKKICENEVCRKIFLNDLTCVLKHEVEDGEKNNYNWKGNKKINYYCKKCSDYLISRLSSRVAQKGQIDREKLYKWIKIDTYFPTVKNSNILQELIKYGK